MDTVWHDIEGYEGRYQINRLGQVRRQEFKVLRKKGHYQTLPARLLKVRVSTFGYQVVTFGGSGKHHSLHRLLAIAFIPRVPGKDIVNHIDGNSGNNSLDNLEWCTQGENIAHGWRMGSRKPPYASGPACGAYKTGLHIGATEEADCIICGKSFQPKLVRIKTCSFACRAAFSANTRKNNQAA